MPPIAKTATSQLTKQQHNELRTILDTAQRVLNSGHVAWTTGQFTEYHLSSLYVIHHEVSQQLALHSDKQFLLDGNTLNSMRDYAQLAEALIDSAEEAKDADSRTEETLKTPSGSFAVSRRLLIEGKAYEHALIVTNPAVAEKSLDEWERKIRQSIEF